VLIGGCHPGDCHYQEGNYKARRRIAILEETLKTMGFDQDRVLLRWISASEGGLFAETIKGFTEAIRAKGPAPTKQLWAL
jgi:F420-non-reducing hydrogenase iron-sulfur subunit